MPHHPDGRPRVFLSSEVGCWSSTHIATGRVTSALSRVADRTDALLTGAGAIRERLNPWTLHSTCIASGWSARPRALLGASGSLRQTGCRCKYDLGP